MQGTVKSYNAKGFGFILSDSMEHDIYFSRESLQQGLRTANIAGTMVSFELARGPGGKPLARNLRPVHGVPPNFYNARSSSSYVPPPRFPMMPPLGQPQQPMGMGMGGLAGPPGPGGGHFVPCPAGLAPPPVAQPRPPVRSLSPHAGSRAMMGLKREEEEKQAKRSASSSSDDGSESSASSDQKKRKKKGKGKKRARSGSSGSDGSEKKKKKNKKRKRRDLRRSSSSSSSSSDGKAEVIGDEKVLEKEVGEEKAENKEIEEAKREALKKLQSLQGIANKEQRMKDWRALLRTWHPDKNPETVEVATAVFQFLQKGKVLLDGC